MLESPRRAARSGGARVIIYVSAAGSPLKLLSAEGVRRHRSVQNEHNRADKSPLSRAGGGGGQAALSGLRDCRPPDVAQSSGLWTSWCEQLTCRTHRFKSTIPRRDEDKLLTQQLLDVLRDRGRSHCPCSSPGDLGLLVLLHRGPQSTESLRPETLPGDPD